MICKYIDRWGQERNEHCSEVPGDPNKLISIQMTAAEWYSQQNLIDQLRRPWVRNANKDRGIRPARSSSGYMVLAAKAIKISGCEAYRITVETPYRLDAFEPDAAKQLVKKDAVDLALELGYNEYRSTYTSLRSCLCCARIDVDYTRNEYYHAVFEASTLPKVVIQK